MDVRLNTTPLTSALRATERPQTGLTPPSAPPIGKTASDASKDVTAPSSEQLGAALDESLRNINKSMQVLSQELEFSIDPDTDRTVVKVVDQRTKEVIRQMPSVEALEIAKALDRLQGLLIRHQA